MLITKRLIGVCPKQPKSIAVNINKEILSVNLTGTYTASGMRLVNSVAKLKEFIRNGKAPT